MSEELLAERQAGLESWREDSVAALVRWGTTLGVDERLIRANPHLALEPSQRMLRDEQLDALPREDFLWVASHLAALVAELLRARHGGDWVVDADPGSPTYTRYVIASGARKFDPPEIVHRYLDSPPPRALEERIAEGEAEASR